MDDRFPYRDYYGSGYKAGLNAEHGQIVRDGVDPFAEQYDAGYADGCRKRAYADGFSAGLSRHTLDEYSACAAPGTREGYADGCKARTDKARNAEEFETRLSGRSFPKVHARDADIAEQTKRLLATDF